MYAVRRSSCSDQKRSYRRNQAVACSKGAAVKLQQGKDKLAERILSEADVHAMLALEPDRRNQVLLRLLYIAGLRVQEIADLK